MEAINLQDSMKNIPVPSKQRHLQKFNGES